MTAPIEFLFDLDARHALGCDWHQWIVCRRNPPARKAIWAGIAFVASTRGVLLRVIREKGITPTKAAVVALNSLPEKFLDWRAGYFAEGST